jgi:LemA protein
VIEVYVVLALLAVLMGAAVASHNRFVRQRHLVEESWRQVDVELRRRHDLIPNLVETVRGFAAHENAALDRVLEARSAAMGAEGTGLSAQVRAESRLNNSLTGLLAVAESYPELQSAPVFRSLQSQLGETEDRLAAARRLHNGNVRALNTRIDSFPSSLVASAMSVDKADYVELDPLERDRLELAPDLSPDATPLGLDPPR